MENGWNLFNINSAAGTTAGGGKGQNSNFTWDIRQHHWSNHDPFQHHPAAEAATASTTHPEASAVHALLFSHRGTSNNGQQYCSSTTSSSSSLYAGVGSQYYHPDPQLMCLKLGKRHYFEDATCPSTRHVAGFSISKRGKPYYGGGGGGMVGRSTAGEVTVAIPATVPRCQVEGCHVALVNAKDYHRRHKVCELHSKAPKVVVRGLEQRFCQQCSRFHAVVEFDDSKRSCRRRLAGHNERRRKVSHHHDLSVSRNNPSQLAAGGRFPYLSSSPTGGGRALSLLSSSNESSVSSSSSPDLSSRCSAALRELIAENRAAAALLARQQPLLVVDKDWPFHHHHPMEHLNSNPLGFGSNHPHIFPDYNEAQAANDDVTLDLMQAPTSAFELLSMRGKSKEEEECSQLWISFAGSTHACS